jgi:hypothetical protein
MDAMTSPADKDEDALARLSQALAEDILAASDESILGEVKDDGGDPAAIAAATRALFEQAAVASNKALLADAKAAVAADRRPSAGVVQLDAAAARRRLARLLAQNPDTAQKLTMAARKGKPGDFSDDEVFGLLEDFEDLGISLPEEPERER